MVPCSMQSQFPYLWSALLQSPHWMPIHGDPGAHEMGVPSHNGDPQRAQLGTPPHPCHDPTPAPRRPGWPCPWCAPGAFPAAKATAESTTGTPAPAPPPDPRPVPPGLAPPLARSRCAPHLHHGLWVSPTPTPVSRRGSWTSFTYCH